VIPRRSDAAAKGGAPPSVRTYVINSRVRPAVWVGTADLDGDGDLDVLSTQTGKLLNGANRDAPIFRFEHRRILPTARR
jgi:hypothetical protein